MNDSSAACETVAACETAFNLTFHPLYRTAQYYSFIILALGVVPLTYFIFWKMLLSTFHGNLKWVISGYFSSVLAFTFYYCLFSLYHCIVPFVAKTKCDLLINKYLFEYGHLIAVVLLTTPFCFPLAISMERIYATKSASHYEQTKVLLGPILAGITIVTDICIIAFIYRNETFSIGSISFAFIPNTSAQGMFTFYWVLFFLNIFNFCINVFLLKTNRKLKRESTASLTVRYQLEEVYLSTKFAISVIFVHIAFFGVYTSSVIFVRYYGSFLFPDSTNLTAVRGIVISMVATYNFVVGFVAVFLFKKIQKRRIVKTRENVEMKTKGSDGAKNYENAMFKVWNSHSNSQSFPK